MQGTISEIRRAYARELKLIDLEKSPEAFQKLRQAYEAALRSASIPAEQTAPAQAERPSEALPEIDPVPELIAQLRLGIANTAQGRIADEELIWKDEVRALLDKLRPLNLTAHAEFERQVGILLLEGWRHGHEALLIAASEAFGWDEAGWHWENLGANGATLNAALALRHCLEHFEESERRRFRYVIRDLRQHYEPTKEALRRDLPYAEFLEKQFRPLLTVIALPERVQAWREALRRPEPALQYRYQFAIAAILIALFYVLKAVNKSPYSPNEPVRLTAPAEVVDHTLRPQALTTVQRKFIEQRIRKELPRAVRESRYDVILDSIGRPHEINLLQSSGDNANDFAVAAGIRDIPRYPVDFPRRFMFSF